jgi:plastocyanin domain-containing protein
MRVSKMGVAWAVAALAAVAIVGVWGCGGGGPAQEIAVVVNDQGFTPDKIQVPRGTNVTLVVTRETEQTCATDITVDGKGIQKELPLHQAVRVPLGKVTSDSVRFACGMGMVEGYVMAQ